MTIKSLIRGKVTSEIIRVAQRTTRIKRCAHILKVQKKLLQECCYFAHKQMNAVFEIPPLKAADCRIWDRRIYMTFHL